MSSTSSTPPLPKIFVDKETISQRVKNYLRDKHPVLSRALSGTGVPREDTKSIWYSKDHIRTWLEEMDYMKADGMRIYLGAYGEQEGPAPGQLCLLMVMTRTPANGKGREDIILENEKVFEERKKAARGQSDGPDIFNGNGLPRQYNYGSPCPPACDPPGLAFPQ